MDLKKNLSTKLHFGSYDACISDNTNKSNKEKLTLGPKRKSSEEDGDDEEEAFPFKLPKLLSNEDDHVYLKENHLYFHIEVTQDTVEQVKKLMRSYSSKISKLNKTHTCVKFVPKPLYLHIYSPGGDVYAGLSLFDYIIEYRKYIPVYTIVEGLAASAATFLSVAGTKRYITPSSYMLIHQLSTFMQGNYEQLKDEFDNSKKLMEKIMNIYETYTSITKKKIPRILKHDLIWDSNECIENGLVDEIKLIDLFNDELLLDSNEE